MDRGGWATVHGVTNSWTQLSDFNKSSSRKEYVCVLVTQSPTLCDPKDCSPPGPFVHGDSPGKNTGVGCHSLLRGSSETRDRT